MDLFLPVINLYILFHKASQITWSCQSFWFFLSNKSKLVRNITRQKFNGQEFCKQEYLVDASQIATFIKTNSFDNTHSMHWIAINFYPILQWFTFFSCTPQFYLFTSLKFGTRSSVCLLRPGWYQRFHRMFEIQKTSQNREFQNVLGYSWIQLHTHWLRR